MAMQRRSPSPRQDQPIDLASYDPGTRRALTPAQSRQLAEWAQARGLDAQSGHAILYHGRPYATIDGVMYQLAQRPEYRRMFRGYTYRALTRDEKGDNGYEPLDVAIEVALFGRNPENGADFEAREVGVVTELERRMARQQIEDAVDRGEWDADRRQYVKRWDRAGDERAWQREVDRRCFALPILRDSRNMAQKRGLRKCVARAFPIGPIADVLREAVPEAVDEHVDPATGGSLDAAPPPPAPAPSSPGPGVVEASARVVEPQAAPPPRPARPNQNPTNSQPPAPQPSRRFPSHEAFVRELPALGLDERGACEVLVVSRVEDIAVAELGRAWDRLVRHLEGDGGSM